MFAEQIQAIIRNPDYLIEGANRCAKAYAEGTPYGYTPFGTESPELVAQNFAGIQAVVSGVGIICSISQKDLESHGTACLLMIANGTCGKPIKDLLHRLANATWGAGQPFRTDKGPLGRADRVNVFDLLPSEEVDKDWKQIQAAAVFLLEKLGQIAAKAA
jgi:hypothetical protein